MAIVTEMGATDGFRGHALHFPEVVSSSGMEFHP